MNPQPPPIQDRKLAASTHLTNTINTPATPLYKENNTPGRLLDVLDAHVQLFTPPATPLPTSNRPALSTSTPASSNSKQTKKLYRGKYEATPRPPPYVPYALKSHGYARRTVSDAVESFIALTALRTENFEPLYNYITKGTPAQTAIVSLSRILYIIANCLADSILGSRKRIIALPILASFVTNAFGFASAVMITIGEAVDTSIPEIWKVCSNGIGYQHGHYAANAALNVALTLVMSGGPLLHASHGLTPFFVVAERIWWTTREARMVMGHEIDRKYKGIVAIILESGMLCPTFLIVHVALQESVRTVINVNLYPVIIQMAGIAPTLIIVRTSLGKSVENVEMIVSTIRFEARVLTLEDVTASKVDLRRGTPDAGSGDIEAQKNENGHVP
ncbi:hypothetical protein Moror_10764 [Moniliophthora roreri MCA 2997]|uniref:Uncharacterized protein n=1 Tax=Moniliophthora roreri (strain MCA 2997) TaxID=1381753 RepID=V2X6G6_MONRO|nr:hypothetical protein Moror_10764 [Moniliophthora roreri MCA 2997]